MRNEFGGGNQDSGEQYAGRRCRVTDSGNELQDLFLYSGKRRPELYLDPNVRKNISSFAKLAPRTELEQGLARLSIDLQTGAFVSIKARFATEAGDYAFIIARADG